MTAQPSRTALLAAVLVLLALASHGVGLRNDFFAIDDSLNVTKNPNVLAGLTFNGLVWAFTSLHSYNWHPLTWISHMIDVQVWGLDPFGHHLTNLLLHAATTALVFLTLRRATGFRWRSAIVASLFAAHPMHVESVAWVAERKDVLSAALFWLLLFVYVSGRSRKHTALALVVFAAGLMAKPMLVTAPIVLLILDVWPLGRLPASEGGIVKRIWSGRGLVLEKWPFFAMSLACGLVTLAAQNKQGTGTIVYESPLLLNLSNATVSYVRYIAKAFWPVALEFQYPFRRSDLLPLPVLAALATLVAISVFVVWQRDRRPWLAFGWAWYVVTLLPVIGIVRIGWHSIADRYLYIPLFGVEVALVWTVAEWVRHSALRRRAAAVVTLAIVATLSALTVRQTMRWRDTITLLEHTISISWDNALAHKSLAAAYGARRDLQKATYHGRVGRMYEAEERSALNPAAPEGYYRLGLAYADVGRHADALPAFERAIQLRPRHARTWVGVGISLAQLERIEDAIAAFETALELDPTDRDAAYNLEVMRKALRARQPQPAP